MNSALQGVDAVLLVIRYALATAAVGLAILFFVDWLVRTRRVNVFGPIGRFSRARIDPLIAPMERKVVRAGGTPASAALWALAVVVIGGILLLSLLDFLRAQVFALWFSVNAGPGGIFRLLVAWTFSFLQIAILVRVISSWLPVSPYSPWIRWSYVVSEPLLRPLRAIIPTLGPIDITPIVAWFLLRLLQGAVLALL